MSSTAITWIIIGLIVLFVLWIIMIYNGLVALRQRVNQAFSDVDVQTKQRHDHERVEAAPAQPIEPRRDIGRDDRRACLRGCLSYERVGGCHLGLIGLASGKPR